MSICQGSQKCIYNFTYDDKTTVSANDNTICLGTMCFTGQVEAVRKEIVNLAGATFLVAP